VRVRGNLKIKRPQDYRAGLSCTHTYIRTHIHTHIHIHIHIHTEGWRKKNKKKDERAYINSCCRVNRFCRLSM
jgi:hypothetical protein